MTLGAPPPDLVAPDETLDRLAGDWWILQSRLGQRYSTDDLLVAWSGLQARPDAARVLDLGSGVGSVGLLALLGLAPAAQLTAVEIQPGSAALMRRTVAHNRLDARVRIVESDLRRLANAPTARFDLVLANPPYRTAGAATASPHGRRAAARLELHGGVFDYCTAAARCLAPGGRFCFSHAAADDRPEPAVAAAGLALLARQEVVFREGHRAVIALYTCGREGARVDLDPLLIRHRDGTRSAEYRSVRRRLRIEV